MKTRILTFTILALIAFAGSALAAPMYANSVVDYTPAPGVSAARSITSNALGAPDPILSSSGVNFVALGVDDDGDGFGGSIVLDFGQDFTGWATIYETTYEPRAGYNEYAEIFGWSVADNQWLSLGTVSNQAQGSGAYDGYTIQFSGIFSMMKIVDVTLANGGNNGDGFDVNAVKVNPTPIPGAALLLGSGLVGLVGLRRRFNA